MIFHCSRPLRIFSRLPSIYTYDRGPAQGVGWLNHAIGHEPFHHPLEGHVGGDLPWWQLKLGSEVPIHSGNVFGSPLLKNDPDLLLLVEGAVASGWSHPEQRLRNQISLSWLKTQMSHTVISKYQNVP